MASRYIKIALAACAVAIATACNSSDYNKVEINTPYGKMKVLLYDDTPLHKANFLRLAENGDYDSLLFHRVIEGFMIQGGDPESRYAPMSKMLGSSEIGSPIDAEIVYPQHFHKRGALAAARKADRINPLKMSSGSQFYIVQGTVFTDEQLDELETIHNNAIKSNIFYQIQSEYKDSLQYYQDNGMSMELAELQMNIMGRVSQMAEEQGLFSFSPEAREAYTTIGGAPRLDAEYTVFGEVIEGLDVIDSIAAQPVDQTYYNMQQTNRPLNNIWMTMKVIK
ncbi:MAG: peptidylprolyl isomerase [Bacteroidales bacterium]|nr:peptidylprolyl isomerase [Bacteroidales bacterium]